jgi:GNAT superfamily N-acetyltransferase
LGNKTRIAYSVDLVERIGCFNRANVANKILRYTSHSIFMNTTCKPIPATDFEAALALHIEYLGSAESVVEFTRFYQKYPLLHLGCYLDGKLIGLCYGYPFTEKRPDAHGVIVLDGIAVIWDYWNRGYGTQLLQAWEAQVRALPGYSKIGVGSAANIETENFYLKNGYKPVQLCIKVPIARLPGDYRARGYHFVAERVINGVMNLYVATAVRDKAEQSRIKEEFQADEVIFILEKVT